MDGSLIIMSHEITRENQMGKPTMMYISALIIISFLWDKSSAQSLVNKNNWLYSTQALLPGFQIIIINTLLCTHAHTHNK